MSRAGRLQNAFWDILYGHDNGYAEPPTEGPLHDMPTDEFSALIDRLVEAAWSVLVP